DASPAVVSRMQSVQADVAEARKAVAAGDVDRATLRVDSAAEDLASIRMGAPGGKLLRDIDDVGARLLPGEQGPVDVGPLSDPLQAESGFLEPSVVAAISRARAALQGGRRDEAFSSLRQAREGLAQDTGVAAIDEALQKLALGRNALRRGKPEEARRI